MISANNTFKRAGAVLLVGTILGGSPSTVLAQTAAPEQAPPANAPAPAAQPAQPATATLTTAPVQPSTIRSVAVRGNQRLEPETVRAYANLSPGLNYTPETVDQALKDLYATELFKDVQILGADTGNIVIQVQENPVINRIVLDGNKRIKEDKILPEIKLAPRQIFTASKVRADVERIVELYRRQGRFAARVEPKTVQLEQNRVDLVFEIYEGDKSKVRSINIIGNEQFSDGRLRKEMFTRQAGGLLGFFKSNDSYDPDRLAADQQKLRAFYLTEGYADFRVVSALAELTPDRRDFVITYVVEEGPRYRFGPIKAESLLRDLPPASIQRGLKIREGEWFDAKAVEDAVTDLNEVAGALGYATADINPQYNRDAEKKVMGITFQVGETPRQYVERIDVNGNTITRDKVIRREFRINEGDAFNAIKIRRSQDRIQSLGYFQEKLEIKDEEGSTPDRRVLSVDVEEKSSGELQLSGGYSSLERFILAFSIAERNFMGKGQELNAGISYSKYSKSVQLGFVEPYLFDKAIMLGGDIFRRDYNSFNYIGNQRNTTYSQVSTGLGLRTGFPVTEYLSFGTRYSLQQDKVTLDKNTFYSDLDGDGIRTCEPLLAGRYLCDEIGKRLTSLIGYSAVYDSTDGIRPTKGRRFSFSQDFAGLGGDVRYIRSRVDASQYLSFGGGFVFSALGQAGYIHPLQGSPGVGRDAIRLTDRFFGPQLRGFDIRGIGPRIRRVAYDVDGALDFESRRVSDSIGGRAFYMGRLEVEPPISAGLKSMGLRPSAFLDIGSLWNIRQPVLTDIPGTCVLRKADNTIEKTQTLLPGQSCATLPTGLPATDTRTFVLSQPGYKEFFLGNSAKPRLSIGIGVNWVSPFGPFRIDIAKALLKQEGDDTKFFSFNVGTNF
ncbi:outer membrane protein assembly factor BamA [Sphingomonas piscis]|uniref:Outer membrane protein assembly factor BamA n=1 Tax=Sphingomonas piscis TaxID=2714943 RepID=A0A6G7YLF4_9SPHN|nr:outer membrane protein assembly factor BamA [Sphingomonas piscis]QIK77570.1 outer membrane protein assembly factor BamA [Sphingomonas piscis]